MKHSSGARVLESESRGVPFRVDTRPYYAVELGSMYNVISPDRAKLLSSRELVGKL